MIKILQCRNMVFAIVVATSGGFVSAGAPHTAAANHIAEITLRGQLLEHPRGFSFSGLLLGRTRQSSLTQTVARLVRAARDPSLQGVFLNMQSFHLSLTQAQELGGLISNLRAQGKKVAVFSPDFNTNTYLLASYANAAVMPRHGDLFLPGVAVQLMFFKGLLSKLDLQVNMIQIGKFKGAQEPLTRNSASPAFARQIHRLITGWYGQIVSTIAKNRPNLSHSQIISAINTGWMQGARAQKKGFVDQLDDRENVTKWVKTDFDGPATLIAHYGIRKTAALNLSNPLVLLRLLSSPSRPRAAAKPAVAVICADGVITDDSPGTRNNANLVTPARIRREIKSVLQNTAVKAIVLRVNSPGGSAQASEEIWQILHAAGKHKPLLVSVGAEAASGGYYISTAGREILADPGSIVGSIGVVGGKVVLGGLFKRIGLHIQTFSIGKHAAMFDSTTAFTPGERAFITHMMKQTYALFTRRVMEGRGKKIRDIQKVARGRLFPGSMAVSKGLVDRVGSLHDATVMAARDGKISGSYRVLVYPHARSLAALIRQRLGVQTELPAGLTILAQALPESERKTMLEMSEILRLLRQNNVILAAPVGIVQP
ncbi:MAG: signal peptide peptidase SppA [Phycisphaerae bacterium]